MQELHLTNKEIDFAKPRCKIFSITINKQLILFLCFNIKNTVGGLCGQAESGTSEYPGRPMSGPSGRPCPETSNSGNNGAVRETKSV